MEYRSLLNESALDLRDIAFDGSSDGILKVVSSTVGVYALSGQFSTIGDTISVINLNGLNTGMLAEGSNLYYTDTRFDTRFAVKSTTNLSEGTNLYWTDIRFDNRLSLKTTTHLAEGVNLYYTDARARNAISGGTGISYDSSTGVITNLLSGGTVTSITGTANQVIASASVGAVTLSLPQSIATSSTVQFGNLTIGTGSTNSELARISANNQAWMGFYTSGLQKGLIGTDTGGDGLLFYSSGTSFKFRTQSGPILFYPGSSVVCTATFTDTGLVGIGTDTPAALFHVSALTSGAGIGILEDRSTGSANIQLQFRSQYAPLANSSKICGSVAAAPSNTGGRLIFNTAQNTTGTLTERMRIDDVGYITFGTGSYGMGFGTTDASTGFWIRNDGFNTVISTKNGSMYYGYGGASGISHLFYSGTGTPSETMRIANNNVGIGTPPAAKLHVSASVGSPSSYANYGLLLYDSGSAAASYGLGINSSTLWANTNAQHEQLIGGVRYSLLDTTNFNIYSHLNCVRSGGYCDSAFRGVGGSYVTLFNTNSGGYSSQIGHDGTTMYISTGAGGNMYFQTYAANYAALNGRMMLDQAGRLSFNSMTANATLTLFGTASAPMAGICLGGYGYDATPYHRLELSSAGAGYHYYMSQNIVWSSTNNRWEFVSAGGWGGYGSMWDFYGNGNCAFSTATNVAGLPSFKTNLALTNDGNCAMYHNLTVSGSVTVTAQITNARHWGNLWLNVVTYSGTFPSSATVVPLATSKGSTGTTPNTSTYRITVNRTAVYTIKYDVSCTAQGGYTYYWHIKVNGSAIHAEEVADVTTTSGSLPIITTSKQHTLTLNSGDYIELYHWASVATRTVLYRMANLYIHEY